MCRRAVKQKSNQTKGLNLPRKSVVGLTDRLDMTIDVDSDVKPPPQQQHKFIFHILNLCIPTCILWYVHIVNCSEENMFKPIFCQSQKIFNPCMPLLDSSILINWTIPFIIQNGICHNLFYLFIYYYFFYYFELIEILVSKQCRPWSDPTFCGVWSGSARFAKVSLIRR